MNDLEQSQEKLREFGFGHAVPQVVTLDQISFKSIVADFKPPVKSHLRLPRIAFFGLFYFLSMSDQRHICKNLGFEYFEQFGFDIQNGIEAETLSNQLSSITGRYTKLIVLGDVLPPPRFDFTEALYKTLDKQKHPEFIKHQIPIIFESEIVKIHLDYPNIDKKTKWNDAGMI
jgi:hypothetical protein